ncbi:MAG TPA: DUF6025 family protein [Telluria sp.]|jgi:hypothetical protein
MLRESGLARADSSPLALLEALDLIGDGRPGEKISHARIEDFARRRCAFDWLHLGHTDLAVGRLLDVVAAHPHLLPPRSGHMGNWEAIASGRAGAMDFNRCAATGGRGYPLVYAFNQTEDSTLSQGDCVYLPGSLIEDGRRIELALHTWDGNQFVLRDRSEALFTPFVRARDQGQDQLEALTRIHARRMRGLTQFRFGLEPEMLMRDEPTLRAVLATLIDDAAAQPNARIALQELFGRQAGLDGIVTRQDMFRQDAIYSMNGTAYGTLEQTVEAAILPLLAVSAPERFDAMITSLPPHIPVVATPLIQMLCGLFSTHYPDSPIDRASMTQPFNPHFHWGARDMAGYPPVHNGYFARSSRAKSATKICGAVLRNFKGIDPLLFILMPVTIFMLCPTSAHEGDHALLADLIARVRRHSAAGQAPAMAAVQALVNDWLADVQGRISPYFIARFERRSGVLHKAVPPAYSEPFEPAGFHEMTLRQACMTVGALMLALNPDTPVN